MQSLVFKTLAFADRSNQSVKALSLSISVNWGKCPKYTKWCVTPSLVAAVQPCMERLQLKVKFLLGYNMKTVVLWGEGQKFEGGEGSFLLVEEDYPRLVGLMEF